MKRALVALFAALTMTGVMVPTPAHAAPAPWSILNESGSNDYLHVFANSSPACDYTGDRRSLGTPGYVTGSGYDWFTPQISNRFDVRVYRKSDGAFLVLRKYYYGECVKAYDANKYKVIIF